MAGQTWLDAMAVQQSAGTQFCSYTTSKSIIPATALETIYPNRLKIGSSLHIFAAGGISNIVTTPGTVTFEVKIGSVIAFTTGAIQMNTTAHTDLPFWLDIYLTCRAIGSGTSANMMGQGKIVSKIFVRTAGTGDDTINDCTLLVPATAPAVGTGFDSTVENILDLWMGFSVSDAANCVRVQQYIVTRHGFA